MKRTFLITAIGLASLLALFLTEAGFAQQISSQRRIIVGFRDGTGQEAAERRKTLIRDFGGKVRHSYRTVPAVAAELSDGQISKLRADPGVAYIEEDGLVQALADELPWGVDRIDAELVHPYNTGAGVKVAVIDTGIDLDHEDLSVTEDVTFVDGTTSGDDDSGHGTHCAGIIAALDNEIGVIGVAPGASIYAVKVLDSTGSGWVSDVVAGIEWAIVGPDGVAGTGDEADIISMSLGSNSNITALHTACDNAYGAGILVVAAAGNDYRGWGTWEFNTVDYPARYDSVIAVGAIDDTDTKASFSSTGSTLELVAPGVNVYSTVTTTGDPDIAHPSGYNYLNGTSMACPHVAGVAALVLAGPGGDVRATLQDTADDLGDPGKDNWYGYGLVDADEAAPQIGPPDEEPPAITGATGNFPDATTGEPVTISATITDNVGVASATIHYTPIDATVESTVSMTAGADNLWSANVPVAPDKVGSITYYITAEDAAGNTATDPAEPATYSITVTDNDAPATEAGPDQTVNEDTNVNFDGSGSSDNIGIVGYKWDTDSTDGVNFETPDLTGQTPTLSGGYADPGTYVVTLQVADGAGNTATDTLTVTVKLYDVTPPSLLTITGNTSTTTGDPVDIVVAAEDNSGSVTSARIFIDGDATGIEMAEGPADTFTYAYIAPIDSVAPHDYYVQVYDDSGNSVQSAIFTITVTDNDSPMADAGTDRSGLIGQPVTFDGSGSFDNIGITSYSWDFGDGTSTAAGVTAEHAYDTAGTYTVTLTVNDAAGNSSSDTLTVTVTSEPLANVQIYRIRTRDTELGRIYYVGAYLRNYDSQTAIVTARIDIFDPDGALVSWSGLNDEEVTISGGARTRVAWSNSVPGNAKEGTYTAVVYVLQTGSVLDTASGAFQVTAGGGD